MFLEKSRIGILLQKKNQNKILKYLDSDDVEPVFGMSVKRAVYGQYWVTPNYPPCKTLIYQFNTKILILSIIVEIPPFEKLMQRCENDGLDETRHKLLKFALNGGVDAAGVLKLETPLIPVILTLWFLVKVNHFVS